jgi:hypothetical protein
MQAKMKEIKTLGGKKIRKIYRAERHKEEMEMMIKR